MGPFFRPLAACRLRRHNTALTGAQGRPVIITHPWRQNPIGRGPHWSDAVVEHSQPCCGAFRPSRRPRPRVITLPLAATAFGYSAKRAYDYEYWGQEFEISSGAHVVQPATIPNKNWLRPGFPSRGQQEFGDDLLARHKFILIPSTVSKLQLEPHLRRL